MDTQKALAIAYHVEDYGHRDWLAAYEHLMDGQTNDAKILVSNLAQWRNAQVW